MSGPGLLLLVRRSWRLVLVTALLAGFAAWVFASHATKTYSAETTLLVGPVSADFNTLHASGELGKTYAELATSRPIVDAAARAAGITPTPSEGAVSATSNDVTRIVDVRVSSASATNAARMADAVAAQLMRLRGRLPVQAADAATAVMRDPALAPLPRNQRQAVRVAVGRLGLSSTAGDLAVIERAVVPRHPDSPKIPMLVLAAVLGGAAAALMFASIRESLARIPIADDEWLAAFETESSFAPQNGNDRETGPQAVERWLGEVRSGEPS
jgi:capsular polysaccharide biosynthesis protein